LANVLVNQRKIQSKQGQNPFSIFLLKKRVSFWLLYKTKGSDWLGLT
jgi:hypothetical protein